MKKIAVAANTEKKETCINCGIKMAISKYTIVDNRIGYIEGAGQLCYDCYIKIYEQC